MYMLTKVKTILVVTGGCRSQVKLVLPKNRSFHRFIFSDYNNLALTVVMEVTEQQRPYNKL